jgi:CRP/FNR family transcriptional regulator, cyclic AMP receptor protein
MARVTELLALAADLPVETVPTGAALIEEGSTPSRMYVLASGSVSVERDGVEFARIDTPGAVFGEMAVVLERTATATVRATSDVVVHVVEDPKAFLVERPGAALAVLRMTAARLDGMTQYLVDVKEQFAGLDGHLQAPAARTGSARDPEGHRDT